jgi:hypothetical protein
MARLPKYEEDKDEWNGADFNAFWTQQNGATIRIREMSDRHLTNTLRMLKRNVETNQADEFFDLTGRCDVEGDILEAVDDLMDKNWLQLYLARGSKEAVYVLRSLLREVNARELHWEVVDVTILSDEPKGKSGWLAVRENIFGF